MGGEMVWKFEACLPLARSLLVWIVIFGCASSGFAASLRQSQWDTVSKTMLVAADHMSAVRSKRRPSRSAWSIAAALKWAGAVGYVDAEGKHAAGADTLYRIGSISKLFTDILVMQLVQRRELDLDAPVSRYLPDFAPRNPFGGADLLRQLTSHRSGLVREAPQATTSTPAVRPRSHGAQPEFDDTRRGSVQ